MGLGSVSALSTRLIAHGADPETPAAAIENGTRADQRVVVATLAGLADAIAVRRLDGPALVVIGSVVGLRERLDWFSGWPRATLAASAPTSAAAE
jgi:uroporphyrin-III C-methyltransferase/precorrin-2 dehydrogenase/sirohydrochlorin ferrochelatase